MLPHGLFTLGSASGEVGGVAQVRPMIFRELNGYMALIFLARPVGALTTRVASFTVRARFALRGPPKLSHAWEVVAETLAC